MQSQIQYVNDTKGKLKSVILPASEWKKILSKLETLEQQSKVKKDLSIALKEVELMQKGKLKKHSLKELLDEL